MGHAGNPLHDDVFPPSEYDIVDEVNLRRRELGAPLNRLWFDGQVTQTVPVISSPSIE